MNIPTQMRAARLDTAAHRISIQHVAVPTPGPGEVLDHVRGCGICLSDVHIVPAVALSQVPEHIPFEQAAILADAVSTPYSGLVDRAA